MRNRLPAGLAGVLTLALCGCSGETGNGRLTLSVTDAPMDDVTALVVQFDGVVLTAADGSTVELPIVPARQVDLLALAGGGRETILHGAAVPAGGYQAVRLKLGATQDGTYDSYVVTTQGSQFELEVQDDDLPGLTLAQEMQIPAEEHLKFTIDFDLRKSVAAPDHLAGSYRLRPALRIVDDRLAGGIAGKVANSLVTDECTPAVYIFSGTDTEPDDLDGNEPDAVTTVIPKLDPVTGTYTYRAAFLNPGAYTAVFMCNAADDQPAVNDSLLFGGSRNALVEANRDTTVDF